MSKQSPPQTPNNENVRSDSSADLSENDEAMVDLASTTFPTGSEDSNLEHRLHTAEKEVEEWREKALRAIAEMENNRRRLEREKEEFARYAHANLIKDLLPVIDNLSRAIEASGDNTQEPSFGENLRKGISMVEEEIRNVFGQYNVTLITPKQGDPFDPQYHEAMTEIRDEKLPPSSIVLVLDHGYMLFDRLLRPSRVAVNARDINAKKTGQKVDVKS